MIILWTLLTIAAAHKVVDSNEDIGPEAFNNVTQLYPTNITSSSTREEKDTNKSTSKSEATVWKIEASFTQPPQEKNEDNSTKEVTNDTKEFRPSQPLDNFDDITPTSSVDSFSSEVKKPASGFVSSPITEFRSTLPKIPKTVLQTYKEYPYRFEDPIYTKAKDTWSSKPDSYPSKTDPWPSKTNYYEKPVFGSLNNDWSNKPNYEPIKPDSWPIKQDAWSNRPDSIQYKPDTWPPKPDSWYKPNPFPFKHDSLSLKPEPWPLKADSWRPGLDSLESKPTMESPVRVPAGGLYYQDPFKEKPEKDPDDFGLEFVEGYRETSMKKQSNPFQDFLRFVTAFIPVGLIISALTPSIITIENTGPEHPYTSNLFRRSDPEISTLPVISERCRRRLLCELHSDTNYLKKSPRGRQCHRIRCEDSDALTKTLQWLLNYRQTHNGHNT